jgi:hypothetical protein
MSLPYENEEVARQAPLRHASFADLTLHTTARRSRRLFDSAPFGSALRRSATRASGEHRHRGPTAGFT